MIAALDINLAALDTGGTLATIPGWRGVGTELRLIVRRSRTGARKYDIREFYLADDPWRPGHCEWKAGRSGISGLCGSELRALLRLLRAGEIVIPTRRAKR